MLEKLVCEYPKIPSLTVEYSTENAYRAASEFCCGLIGVQPEPWQAVRSRRTSRAPEQIAVAAKLGVTHV